MASNFSLHHANYSKTVRQYLILGILKRVYANTPETHKFTDISHWCQNSQKIDSQIDSNAMDYKEYLVQKASLLLLRSDHFYDGTYHPGLAKTAFKMLKSIRFDSDAICIYSLALYVVAVSYFERQHYEKSLKFNLRSEKAIDEFKDISTDIPAELEIIHDFVLMQIYDANGAVKDAVSQVQYAVLLIQRAIRRHSGSQTGISAKFLTDIQNYVHTIIDLRHFAQVNYFLGALMVEVEKTEVASTACRGSQMDLQVCKQLMNSFFAHWAIGIVRHSLKVKMKEFEGINEKILTIPEVVPVLGNNKYDKKFPVQPIKEYTDFQKCLFKGKECVLKIMQQNEHSIHGTEKAVKYWNELLQLEKDVNNVFFLI